MNFFPSSCDHFLSLALLVSALTVSACSPAATAQEAGSEHVILLHGLSRTDAAMRPMEEALQKAGYQIHNVRYPSRKKTIRVLTDEHLAPVVQQCRQANATKIHFVTHSMGGIMVRDYLSRTKPRELGRVVMLAPPNQGSEVVDRIGHWKAFKAINGPAGQELGTKKTSTPQALGPVDFPCGIIAGSRSINWINSGMIEGADDGKVSVENTKVKGMTDHVVIPRTHPMIMQRKDGIALTLRFLEKGKFE